MNGWQKDENGRCYRMIGDCKEYAPDMIYTGKADATATVKRKPELKTGKDCPFRSGLHTDCVKDCALYGNVACFLSVNETVYHRDTRGMSCPIYKRECNDRCGLYSDGCGIFRMINKLFERGEKQ